MGNNSISPTQDNRPFIDDKWSGQWLGRPRICTVKGLDLRIIFVFHFGVLDNVYDMLARDDAHVYFPLGIEGEIVLLSGTSSLKVE